ncbi:MAG TPA: D-alanyl-D-alanine carboxypeptidase family protein [Jiangellaceae bacterium]
MSLVAQLAAALVAAPLLLGAAPVDPVGGELLGTVGAPVVSSGSGVPVLPEVEAAAWLVADAETGNVLAAYDAHVPLPPASTIKLLTALAVLPVIEPDQSYTASEENGHVEGSRVGMVPGETYSLADLEHGLFLASGNDAAHGLAELVGGLAACLELMNAEAARLGAFDTHAATPHGLDEPGQVSSAYDLALFGRAVLADAELAEIAQTRNYAFPGLDGQTFQIQNQNRLLGSYDGAIGLKTGYTTEAGHTLVAAAERGDTRLVVTVLGADGRAEPVAAELLDWGFAAAGTAEPVGVLVTPEDVAAAAEARVDDAAADPPAPESEEPSAADAADLALGSGIPPWWPVGVAALAVLGLLAVRQRRRRSRGRYAA